MRWPGLGFTDYLQVKRSARARWQQTYREQQDELAGLRAATHVKHHNVAPGRRLEIVEREAVPRPPDPLQVRATLTDSGGVVEVSAPHVTHRLTLDALSVGKGSRLLVSGRVRPSSGSVRVTGRVGLLEQDTRFADPSVTAAQIYALAVGAEGA